MALNGFCLRLSLTEYERLLYPLDTERKERKRVRIPTQAYFSVGM